MDRQGGEFVDSLSFILVLEGDGICLVIKVFDSGESDDGTFSVSAEIADGEFGGLEFKTHPDIPDFMIEGIPERSRRRNRYRVAGMGVQSFV